MEFSSLKPFSLDTTIVNDLGIEKFFLISKLNTTHFPVSNSKNFKSHLKILSAVTIEIPK